MKLRSPIQTSSEEVALKLIEARQYRRAERVFYVGRTLNIIGVVAASIPLIVKLVF